MAWSQSADAGGAGGGQHGRWSLSADSPAELRAELSKLLRWHGVRLEELFETVDASSDGQVSALRRTYNQGRGPYSRRGATPKKVVC